MSLNIFIERFKSTANIRISQIAYIFTANRLKEYRDKGMTYRAESTKVIQDIGHKTMNDEYNYSFIMAAFDHFYKIGGIFQKMLMLLYLPHLCRIGSPLKQYSIYVHSNIHRYCYLC